MVAVRLHNSAVIVMGGKMKMGYDLTQLQDQNEDVIDFVEDVGVRNGVMVMGCNGDRIQDLRREWE